MDGLIHQENYNGKKDFQRNGEITSVTNSAYFILHEMVILIWAIK